MWQDEREKLDILTLDFDMLKSERSINKGKLERFYLKTFRELRQISRVS
jgi:hypothetical protein